MSCNNCKKSPDCLREICCGICPEFLDCPFKCPSCKPNKIQEQEDQED